jgi:hypothetical protein
MIAISGKWYSASDRLVAMGAGFDHFLEKPADPRARGALSGVRNARRPKARARARFALRPHAARDGVEQLLR